MITKFVAAGLAWLAISGAAMANDIYLDAGVLPVSPSTPFGHVFAHDAHAFTDTIDFVLSTSHLGSSANYLNVKFSDIDVFNIAGLNYSIWAGPSGSNLVLLGGFYGDNGTHDLGDLTPGAYHIVFTGLSNGTSGGAYGVSLVSGVPEPETLAMMLGGLGLMGWVGRRRKSANTTA